jgi:hypothetical protein
MKGRDSPKTYESARLLGEVKVIIDARNRKNNRALTTTISFIREEVNDNNDENDFYDIKN